MDEVAKLLGNVDVDVVVVNTARKMDNCSKYGFVIFDEVHEYTSVCNKEVFWNTCRVKYLLGLSATPNTESCLLPYLETHLGKCMEFDIKTDNIPATVRIVKYHGKTPYIEPVLSKLGNVDTMSTIGQIIAEERRLEIVVDEIMKLYRDGRCIFVFAEMRKYLDTIQEALNAVGVTSMVEDSCILRGGATKDDIEIAADCRIILTTYGYSRRGINYSNFTAVVMTTPRKKISMLEQTIGRILRCNGPKDVIRRITFINDVNTVLRGQVKNHVELYESREYPISIVHRC
jgi:superfamily II DNA or RNA helicase